MLGKPLGVCTTSVSLTLSANLPVLFTSAGLCIFFLTVSGSCLLIRVIIAKGSAEPLFERFLFTAAIFALAPSQTCTTYSVVSDTLA